MKSSPKGHAQPPSRAKSHNPKAVASPSPPPHPFNDTTDQDGLEAPSPVGDSSVSQLDNLPMAGASLPDATTPVDATASGLASDPMIMDAISTIIQALVSRQPSQPMQPQGVPLV